MVVASSLRLPYQLTAHKPYEHPSQSKATRSCLSLGTAFSSSYMLQDAWDLQLIRRAVNKKNSTSFKPKAFSCRSIFLPSAADASPLIQNGSLLLKRVYSSLSSPSLAYKLIPAIGVIALSLGLLPLMRLGWGIFIHKNSGSWKKSSTYFFATSYIQPLLLWTGVLLICRALDPVVLPSESSQAVKQRVLHFVRTLSSVLAFAYCLSCLVQQVQKFFTEASDSSDTRNMGFQFAGKAIYTAVWVASVSLFMELLGFSTQKWLTAGGLGTVLLTLAGREIFTNFLSSMMLHATRPFVVNEWIQTKIEGYEVSGTVEHVGWWSPTVIRGDDREAVYIPNHKFTVNVVRNLTQKTHWRIKTHIAISHLDVNKINIIVADMRKVLAKNPQVEQQRLHRRVFLDNINAENQALLIMISCFVKTSRFEEYLCVKEAILLDLLRVVSHHRARLATPIRTIRKVFNGADVDNVPFSDSVFTSSRAASNHPFLLIEPSYKINGDSKTRTSKKDEKSETALKPISKSDDKTGDQNGVDGNDTGASNSDINEPNVPSPVTKQDEEAAGTTAAPRAALDENIVLGVALEGSKRTLPIEDDIPPPPSSAEKKGDQVSPIGSASAGDSREKQSGG